MSIIRIEVEHNILGRGDLTFLPIFQACCLNFDKIISELFGVALSLQGELAFSLQFAKMNIEQLSGLQKYGIPITSRRWMRACKRVFPKRSSLIWNISFELYIHSTVHRKVARTSNSSTPSPPKERKSAISW